MKRYVRNGAVDEKWIVWAAANDILDNWWHVSKVKWPSRLATTRAQKKKIIFIFWSSQNLDFFSKIHFWVTTTHGLKVKGLKYPINCSKLCNFSDFFQSCMKIHTPHKSFSSAFIFDRFLFFYQECCCSFCTFFFLPLILQQKKQQCKVFFAKGQWWICVADQEKRWTRKASKESKSCLQAFIYKTAPKICDMHLGQFAQIVSALEFRTFQINISR